MLENLPSIANGEIYLQALNMGDQLKAMTQFGILFLLNEMEEFSIKV